MTGLVKFHQASADRPCGSRVAVRAGEEHPMQDGSAIRAEEAGEWLRRTMTDAPERRSELIIRSDEAMDVRSRKRLREILFGLS
jgi:hypothetical protein